MKKRECAIKLFVALLKSAIVGLHFLSLFEKVQLCNHAFFALFKRAIFQSNFFHTFQKCNKKVNRSFKKRMNLQKWTLKRAIAHFQSMRLPNPASCHRSTLGNQTSLKMCDCSF
ncbi:MAG: hypothetical protein FJ333_04595 [Sphingomonadales bacterium]|nr:hypothetical protein [Sphingomonadales bacterium]